MLPVFPDPRVFRPAAAAPDDVRHWYDLAGATLDAETSARAEAHAAVLARELRTALSDAPEVVEDAIEQPPSSAIGRQLWRTCDAVWDASSDVQPGGLIVTPFAIPLVLVVAASATAGASDSAGVLPEPDRIAQILREAGAVGGSETLAISSALVGASALRIRHFAAWRALHDIPSGPLPVSPSLFTPAAITVEPGPERVHLRFLIGTAFAGRKLDLPADATIARWGAKLTGELVRQLGGPAFTLLPLARAPGRMLPARHEGVVAQRDVGAQLFATNAIRKLRSSVGEPVAVISAHRAGDAIGGGELRVSLSSALDEREAEGFRCPVHPIEAITAPLRMLIDLLHDCRVSDVRLLAGVHPDESPSGMRLFFRPDTIPEGALLQ